MEEAIDFQTVTPFDTLDAPHLQKVRQATLIRRYKAGDIVFFEGEIHPYLHILIKGSVTMFKTSPKGNRIRINRFQAPSLIAEHACFDQNPFPATCEFATDGTMGLLPQEILFELLKVTPFALEMLRSLSQKVSILSRRLKQEAIFSAEAKVADLILAEPSALTTKKHNEIAASLNLSAETFSRVLSKFKKEGIMMQNGSKFTFDKPMLRLILEYNRIPKNTPQT